MPMHEPSARELLLNDVLQIENISASQFPQPVDGVRVNRTLQGRRQQRSGVTDRQLREVNPLEALGLPYLLCRRRNRLTVSDGQHHVGQASHHDLMHHEGGKVIEQVYVIDTKDDLGGRRSRRQCLDHSPHQRNRVGDAGRRPRAEGTERNGSRRRCARRQTCLATLRRGGRQRLTDEPALADTF